MREENWKLLIPVERGWYLIYNQISVTTESENLWEFFIFEKRVAKVCFSLRKCLQPNERAAEAVARVRDGSCSLSGTRTPRQLLFDAEDCNTSLQEYEREACRFKTVCLPTFVFY